MPARISSNNLFMERFLGREGINLAELRGA
ncbi:hypothetical protein DSM3645_02533 [Blastopirellula marina DSM 3645]|uniref:Uncharacterized protein n=1 Tax=Blastopirellula marina DSM 3645 TaxID=314230 RepID=A3ZVH0_9BACT|nr:hypothetical protein DSM3645_02533 [Blastopirellula marina DSM 3645]